jgi:hypothetical protein
MKYLFSASLIFASLFVLSGCSEDFEVAAPYRNYTFVYSLLDMGDTAHYVRIQKAFLDENKSALSMATVADSSFYTNVNAYFLTYKGSSSVRIDSIPLVKVDSRNENIPKDSGLFFNDPSYIYKCKTTINPNLEYKLVVSLPDFGTVATARIPVIDTAFIQLPRNPTINFAPTKLPSGLPAKLALSVTVNGGGRAAFGQATLRFRYQDELAGVRTNRFVDFPFPYEQIASGGNQLTVEALNASIYSFLSQSIPALPNVNRYIDSCDVIYSVGGRDFLNYILTQQIQGGLTAEQSRPLFTNLSGTNVFGLVSSRASRTKTRIGLVPITLDSLQRNGSTKSLNFKGFVQ